MKNIKVEGIITALSPIFHGGNEKTGASQLLRRQKFFVDGEAKELPIISGNAVRGYTRRLVMADFLTTVNFKITNISLYHALFSGGVLEQVSGEGGKLNIDLRRKIRTYLPPVAVYGTSYGNQIFSGKMRVYELFPICLETKDLLPENISSLCTHDIYTFLDHSFFTRKEQAGTAGLEKKDEDPTVQMKVDLEVFVPGTKFFHGFSLENPNSVEESLLGHIIALWTNFSYIGGRSSSGFGHIKLSYNNVPDNSPYLTFLEENKEQIIAVLTELNEGFKKK